jgi:hypothetical protein
LSDLSWINNIQRSVCQQLTEFDHLLDAEGYMPVGAFQVESQIAEHGIGGGQLYAGWKPE